MRLIFDSHLDLGWCGAHFGRDLTAEVDDIRAAEQGFTDEKSRGRNVLSLPELRRAGVAVCVATLLARSGPELASKPAGFKRTELDYPSPAAAFTGAHAQLAWYRLMEQAGQMRMIRTAAELQRHWTEYAAAPATTPLGYILSMEGADPIITPSQLQYWWDLGLRAIGPAHYGRGRYAYGTATDGPIGDPGRALLAEMRRLGILLDVTHLTDTSFADAMNAYDGPLLASHHNCRALVPGDRQLTDEQIKQIVARGGVIGVALDAWMMYPNWQRGVTQPAVVGLDALADHIDHICQLAGNTDHAAIGTDLDGGFGYEQTPRDLNKYRDVRKMETILADRGYPPAAIDAIFHGNWLRHFTRHLPRE